jgi:acetyl esterase/lipase
VTWTEVDAGGIPAIWADPDAGATDRVVQYVHGGGYVIGNAHYYKHLTGHIAKAVGCRVLNVDYRLAPEHPHSAPVEDSTTAYRWLLGQGYDPAHLAISGDSAGGGLTLATLLALRDAGTAQPAAAVPISPWADMEATGDTMTTNAVNDALVQAPMLLGMAGMFLNGHDPKDPLAAPIHADFSGIAPLYIQVGGHETLLDDAKRVAEAAQRDGVDVTLEVFPEMQHVFQIGAGNVPESDDAIAKIGAFLRPRLGL